MKRPFFRIDWMVHLIHSIIHSRVFQNRCPAAFIMKHQLIWWLCIMIAYTLKERVFQNEWLIFGNSHHLLAVVEENHEYSWSAGWDSNPDHKSCELTSELFFAVIPVAVEALKAVTIQADRLFSFRTGKIASTLYGVTTGILRDTSLANKDESCCEFYTSSAQIPCVSSPLQRPLYGSAFHLLVISMVFASRHPSGI